MTRRFTGWHMAAIMVAFFGVVIGVNVVMAASAIRTFGGVVVENSYVASQKFDDWLDAARAQRVLGWRADASVGSDGRVVVKLVAPAGAVVRARIIHPLGLQPGHTVVLRPLDKGRYVSDAAIPAGRWLLRIQVEAQGRVARFEQEVRR